MSSPLMKALFVTLALALLYQLGELLPYVRRPLPRCLIHGAMGLCALLTGNTIGGLFGLALGVNALTLPVAVGLGLPGVGLLWALRLWL